MIGLRVCMIGNLITNLQVLARVWVRVKGLDK